MVETHTFDVTDRAVREPFPQNSLKSSLAAQNRAALLHPGATFLIPSETWFVELCDPKGRSFPTSVGIKQTENPVGKVSQTDKHYGGENPADLIPPIFPGPGPKSQALMMSDVLGSCFSLLLPNASLRSFPPFPRVATRVEMGPPSRLS